MTRDEIEQIKKDIKKAHKKLSKNDYELRDEIRYVNKPEKDFDEFLPQNLRNESEQPKNEWLSILVLILIFSILFLMTLYGDYWFSKIISINI